MGKRRPYSEAVGKQFNDLFVLEIYKIGIHTKAYCICKCGKTTLSFIGGVLSGHTRSCGCYRLTASKKRTGTKSAQYVHGHELDGKKSPTLSTYHSMLQRCKNPSSNSFKNYGAKGVTICDRWLDFNNFLVDMGERPKDTTIDRINNSKGYSPDNCRWATKKEQAINRKSTLLYTMQGETKCLKDWAREYGIRYLVVFKRIKRGWSLQDSLKTPYKLTKQNQHLNN